MTSIIYINLFELVKRLPKELKPEHYDVLIGDCFKFTAKEADDVVKAANIIISKINGKRKELTFQRCTAFKGGVTCYAEIKDKGVEHSGFCESCFYPGIVADYALYKTCRAEGYSRKEALELSGIDSTLSDAKKTVTETKKKRY